MKIRQNPYDLTALRHLTEIADYIIPFALRVAARMNIADCLASGPMPIEAIASSIGADKEALGRLLRCLASRNVFEEVEPGCFALTALSELLTTRNAVSLRDAFPLIPAELYAWARMDDSLRTGEAAFPMVHGQHYWEYMKDNPDASRRIDGAVESSNHFITRMFSRIYDWNRFSLLVDVGGGNGSFLAGILARHTNMRGIVFDQAHVVDKAPPVLARARVENRCWIVAGSFFDRLPGPADGYLLKTILHDWNDQQALAILRAVRRAIPANGRLLVIEALLSPGNGYDIGKLLDLNSFVLAGGLDRTEEDFALLLNASNFQLERVVRTTNALALMIAAPVPTEMERAGPCT